MINLELLNESEPIDLKLQKNSGGTSDYNDLSNKPKINGVELQGSLTLEDLGIIVNAVKDILINGTSIVNEGVADIPIASVSNKKLGLIRLDYATTSRTPTALNCDSTGLLYVRTAGEDNIAKRSGNDTILSVQNMDMALKYAMTDGKGAEWTTEEKASARNRMGLEWKCVDTIEVSDVAQADITFPQNYSEFMVIADVQGNGTSIIYPQMAYFNADGELLDRSSQHSDFYPSDKAEHYELLFEKMNVESDTYFRMSGFEKTDFVFPKLKQNIQTTGWQQWYDATNAYQCHMWYGVKFSRTITSATFKLYAR